MEAAAERYAALVAKIPVSAPLIPVIHNVDVAIHASPVDIKQALIAQLSMPVRWQATILKFVELETKKVGECGPGKVLAPLVRRCASDLSVFALNTPDEITNGLAQFEAGG